MQKIRLIIILALFVSLQAACHRNRTAALEGRPVINSERLKNGQVMYMRYCESCHPGGLAGLGPGILGTPSFLKRFQVRHGLGTMPAFKKETLPKKDLDDIILYLKAVKKASK
ncbi:cytochrome c [Chitinophaga sedimenti]|uniref:c-type cytochrome n=1 Tax=Chitinophaga sedimenti TaxID=2033606 RepID=UPI002006ABC7|nr:cytochrome c [Chitinophaga sedimenti]MCK7553658.1 cytochrome c [Chitinophaga sedimenti]